MNLGDGSTLGGGERLSGLLVVAAGDPEADFAGAGGDGSEVVVEGELLNLGVGLLSALGLGALREGLVLGVLNGRDASESALAAVFGETNDLVGGSALGEMRTVGGVASAGKADGLALGGGGIAAQDGPAGSLSDIRELVGVGVGLYAVVRLASRSCQCRILIGCVKEEDNKDVEDVVGRGLPNCGLGMLIAISPPLASRLRFINNVFSLQLGNCNSATPIDHRNEGRKPGDDRSKGMIKLE